MTQVRPVSGAPRKRYRFALRLTLAILRWTFITIGAMASAVFVFAQIYHANTAFYDPATYAIGVGGLFSIACGVMLMLLSRNSRLHAQLLHAKERCEELADHSWRLKDAEARATSLLETQGDVIVRRDCNGYITYANDAYCALAGESRETLLGTTAAMTVLTQGRTDALPDGTRMRDEQIATTGGARWVAWRDVVVWTEKDKCTEVQSVGRDITDRIATERALAEARDAAEAASGAKSRFLAMVSHEIRTPLNGILGMADLLLETPLSPEQATYVKATKTSGDALLSLIEEILDFSKIEAGKLELENQPFLLPALVEDVVELLGPRAQAKGLEIASDVDDRLPPRVLGDAIRLRQVLLNLAGNAIKFSETGGVSVIVEAGAGPGEIVFEVRDTGIGIAPEQQSRIFHEFEQVEGGSARKFGGTGLGLAISRRIVERMAGRIEVSSAVGKGSTFRAVVKLPTIAGAGGDDAMFMPPDLTGMAVLIVAASTIEASLIARRLARWHAAVTVVTAERAAELIPDRTWDAVLVDHSIGTKEAAALADAVDDSVARRIVLIPPGERHRLAALKEAGFTGYLVKPVRAASLKAQITATSEPFDASATTARPGDRPIAAPATGDARESLAVLVAEDNEINALLATALLTRLGHRPTVATNGAAALDCWRAAHTSGAPYDLVLMDMQMPGIDGLEAARRIRAAETEHDQVRTPIIALTANAFGEDRDACMAAGMDGFLVKPLDRDRLLATLESLVGRVAIAA